MADNRRSPEGSRFRFGLIGRFSVQKDGQHLPDAAVGSRKGRILLKLLLVNRKHVVSTEDIAEGADPSRVAASRLLCEVAGTAKLPPSPEE